MTGKDAADQPAAPLGQGHHDEAPIVATALLLDEPTPHEVTDHHRRVAVAAQQLGAQIALAERAVVQQCLQHAELADGEAGLGHDPTHPGGDGLGGAHELDVGVEGGGLGDGARVARGHSSNSNGLYDAPRPLSSGRGEGRRRAARER